MTRFQRLNLVFGLALLAVTLALPLYEHSTGDLRAGDALVDGARKTAMAVER